MRWLIRSQTIREDDAELYAYALRSLMLLTLPIFMAIAGGLFFHCVKESVLVVLPYMLIRKYSGGYHMSHWWVCFIVSTLVIGFGVWVATVIPGGLLRHACVVLSVISLMAFSPVDSLAKRLDEDEKRHCKRMTVILVCACSGVYVLWNILRWEMASSAIAVGIIWAALTQMPCMIEKICKNNQNQ